MVYVLVAVISLFVGFIFGAVRQQVLTEKNFYYLLNFCAVNKIPYKTIININEKIILLEEDKLYFYFELNGKFRNIIVKAEKDFVE